MATIEVTRLGMSADHMETIAGFMSRVLVEGETPERVAPEVAAFREPFQTVYYSFEEGYPPALRPRPGAA